MRFLVKPVPEPQAILRAWLPFKRAIGVTAVRTESDYQHALATLEALLTAVGDDEAHPLADVLDYLADRVKSYEDSHCVIPEAEPRVVLQFLMDQHGLKQADLADCAPQGRISEILGGQRTVSKALAKRLAARFHVPMEVFL
ncbi:MAG: transcriptional regulator [Candidatus Competibacteraceae bacterium]|nr:transcriptional regulator [Candidatus Competibacteraceae bacterium]